MNAVVAQAADTVAAGVVYVEEKGVPSSERQGCEFHDALFLGSDPNHPSAVDENGCHMDFMRCRTTGDGEQMPFNGQREGIHPIESGKRSHKEFAVGIQCKSIHLIVGQ
jgi:hypothetical protein